MPSWVRVVPGPTSSKRGGLPRPSNYQVNGATLKLSKNSEISRMPRQRCRLPHVDSDDLVLRAADSQYRRGVDTAMSTEPERLRLASSRSAVTTPCSFQQSRRRRHRNWTSDPTFGKLAGHATSAAPAGHEAGRAVVGDHVELPADAVKLLRRARPADRQVDRQTPRHQGSTGDGLGRLYTF